MSFVSYAQNFEDVMLWRALKHVENGFYIDVGAQDPVVDSVSMGFYEQGWRGCHIEPTSQYSEKLKRARPDELVLQLAVGIGEGALSFFEIENTGLSTSEKSIAIEHEAKGFRVRETDVPIISLDSVFEKFAGRDIHWLKVDVEGAEKSVLDSWQSSSVKPWVLVIESTKPMTQVESFEDWESLVLAKGYTFVYFDGLNRYYISPHHSELQTAFKVPPNIFDGFVLSGLASQPFYRRVESRAQQAESQVQQAESRAQRAQMIADQRLAQLQALYASTSWRLTTPVRVVSRILGGDFSIVRKVSSRIADSLKLRISAHSTEHGGDGDSLSPHSKKICVALQREIGQRDRKKR